MVDHNCCTLAGIPGPLDSENTINLYSAIMRADVILRRARRHAGLTQRALSVATEIAQPTIARIERGQESPRADTLARLLSATGWRVVAVPPGGEGIDRSVIAQLIDLTPAERARRAVREAKVLDTIPAGVLARR